MLAFKTPVDIVNRALMELGQPAITALDDTTDRGAILANACYDRLRQAELRRNDWVFCLRKVCLRPLSSSSLLVTPAAYSATTTYLWGSIVSDSDDGDMWVNRATFSLGSTPGAAYGDWESYAGPRTAEAYDSGTTYFVGELVYLVSGVTISVYMSKLSGNDSSPTDVLTWDATTVYRSGQDVLYSGSYYRSITSRNVGLEPDTSTTAWETISPSAATNLNWSLIACSVGDLNIAWPVGAGPITQADTSNVYMLPANHLSTTDQDDKAGSMSYLGAPSNAPYSDWVFDGEYLLSRERGPIVYRFAADVTDVRSMDPMFCEGLAYRIAMALAEPLTQASDKRQVVAQEYQRFMSEARVRNAIQAGPQELPLDDLLACRM